MDDFAHQYPMNAAVEFRKLRSLADRALAQVGDDEREFFSGRELITLIQHSRASAKASFFAKN